MTDLNTEPKQTARRGLAVYLASLAGLSLPVYLVMAGRAVPVAEQPALVVLLMWMPAVASIVARLTVRPPRDAEGVREPLPTGLRRLGRGTLGPTAVALAFPVVVGFASYGVGWSTGLAAYVPGGETAGRQPVVLRGPPGMPRSSSPDSTQVPPIRCLRWRPLPCWQWDSISCGLPGGFPRAHSGRQSSPTAPGTRSSRGRLTAIPPARQPRSGSGIPGCSPPGSVLPPPVSFCAQESVDTG